MRFGHDAELQDVIELQLSSVSAFDSIYTRYNKAVYANIFKMVKQPEFAEDILQDVFLTLWENRTKISTDKAVGGWLFVVSFNKAATFLKKRLKESVDYVESYDPYETIVKEIEINEVDYMHQLSIIQEAVASLPPRKREVFKLCRFEGRSNEDVAQLLGISTDSVKDYLKQSTKLIKGYATSNYPDALGAGLAVIIVHLFNN